MDDEEYHEVIIEICVLFTRSEHGVQDMECSLLIETHRSLQTIVCNVRIITSSHTCI
jgi:hypothetical protein